MRNMRAYQHRKRFTGKIDSRKEEREDKKRNIPIPIWVNSRTSGDNIRGKEAMHLKKCDEVCLSLVVDGGE